MPNSAKKVVLGICTGHGDSSAALIVDGELVAAAEEERFVRLKHYALFPRNAIRYCLDHAGLSEEDVQIVAFPRNPWVGWKQRLSLAIKYPQLRKSRRGTGSRAQRPLKELLQEAGLSHAKLARVEHHIAHLYSARFLCPEPQVALLSFDGLGDFVSTVLGQAQGTKISVHKRIYFPDSAGFFYTAMTQYLGFHYFGEEFKVMGLSSYGKPTYLKAMGELIRTTDDGFQLNLDAFPILRKPMEFHLVGGQPSIDPFFDGTVLRKILGVDERRSGDPLEQVHFDMAKSIQCRFEEVGNHLLKILHSKVPVKDLALAGGCSHNSVWVGKIPQNSPFQNVFVAPAAHDAGISVGAAMAAHGGWVIPGAAHWALTGPSITGPANPHSTPTREFENDQVQAKWMAEELSKGKIIGLCKGRMEFGPRALGARSIIADPRSREMRDRLNERVKHRESFRPFAASVLAEHQENWFEDSFHAPTMEAVFTVRKESRTKIAAVCHVDNSCRIQSITKDTQPFFWTLIDEFRKLTGVPMLVNTSFNDSEPIVCTQEDALKCFANTDLDYLIIENRLYSKTAKELKKAV